MNQSKANFISGVSFFKELLVIGLVITVLYSCHSHQKDTQKSVKVTTVVQKQLPIWTVSIPDSGIISGAEIYDDGMVKNVSKPTITIYSPGKKNSGVAVLVFPGGGYRALAVDMEGADICDWLSSIGITGILLKYRVPNSGPHWDKDCNCEKDPIKPLALEDAQRAVGLVRYHAKEWNINPDKIGVIGFSAGGHLVTDISNNYQHRVYPIMDEADRVGCRPDFGMVMYPGHMTFHTKHPYELNPTIPVDQHTPPTFILQAGNDPVDSIQNSLVYYIALRKAGVPVEYHIYAEGGHAFGIRKTSQPIKDFAKLPIADWTILAERWLHTIKMLGE